MKDNSYKQLSIASFASIIHFYLLSPTIFYKITKVSKCCILEENKYFKTYYNNFQI